MRPIIVAVLLHCSLVSARSPLQQAVGWGGRKLGHDRRKGSVSMMRGGGAGQAPPLATEWEAHVDPSSGKVYFANSATGETSWDPPAVNFGSEVLAPSRVVRVESAASVATVPGAQEAATAAEAETAVAEADAEAALELGAQTAAEAAAEVEAALREEEEAARVAEAEAAEEATAAAAAAETAAEVAAAEAAASEDATAEEAAAEAASAEAVAVEAAAAEEEVAAAEAAAAAAAGGLASGWVAAFDGDGRPYFANAATGQSSYEPPPGVDADAMIAAAAATVRAAMGGSTPSLHSRDASWHPEAVVAAAAAAASEEVAALRARVEAAETERETAARKVSALASALGRAKGELGAATAAARADLDAKVRGCGRCIH